MTQHTEHNPENLRGRIALITGASRGIGAATAKLFAANGATVAVNYHRSEAAAHQVVADIQAAGGKALAVQASVDNVQQLTAMVDKVEAELGPIDTLVMNATAVHQFVMAPFVDTNWDVFKDMVLGEIAGVYFPAQVLIPRMIERKHGNLIAVSSQISKSNRERTSAHSAAKAGVDSIVRVLATELGPHGIRVNAVAPGLVETDATSNIGPQAKQIVANMTPLRRIAQPEDVAGAILLLALEQGSFITGQYLAAGGGSYMH